MAKEDKYLFSGLDNGGWFGQNFAAYTLFGYVGDRERLQQAIQQNQSLARKMLEIVLPKLKISALLKVITGFDLPNVATDSGLAKQLFDLLAQEENRRTLYEQLTALQKRALKEGRFFQSVSRNGTQKKAALSAPALTLEDKLITVEGQLVHRDSVQQHSKIFAATLRASTHEWILCDYPPHALNEKNERFKGCGLLLREDAGFSKAFARYLPFNPEMGWYPYVRVTGFFSSAKASTEGLSSLSMSLVEFREPKKYLEVRADLVELGSGELRHPIYLDRWSDLVLFLYLLPIVTAGSNLASSDISPELAAILRAYAGKIASDVPHALAKFYGSLPLPQDA